MWSRFFIEQNFRQVFHLVVFCKIKSSQTMSVTPGQNRCDVTAMSSPILSSFRLESSCLVMATFVSSWHFLLLNLTKIIKCYLVSSLFCPVKKKEYWSHIVNKRWVFLSMLPVLKCNAQFSHNWRWSYNLNLKNKYFTYLFALWMHCVKMYYIIRLLVSSQYSWSLLWHKNYFFY